MIAFGASDTGRVRRNNEDNFFLDEALRLAVVADGMGGEACGEVASALTVEELSSRFRNLGDGNRHGLLCEAVEKAHSRVQQESRTGKACGGMGSTVVALTWELPRVEVASVGDSRVYLFRAGTLYQITDDQNLGNQMRDSMGWSDEQVSKFPQRHILTSAVGAGESIRIQQHTLDLMPGDRLLLCTDGLHGMVSADGIARMMSSRLPISSVVHTLIAAANEAGGGDNVTAVVLEWERDELEETAEG